MSDDATSKVVGAKVTVTLTNDVKVTGTVFTYDTKNAAMVLLQNPASERPTVKVINACYMKAVTVNEKYPKDPEDRLPQGVAQDAELPSLVSGNERLQRKLNKSLTRATDRRRYETAGGAMGELTVAACMVFDRLTVSCGQVLFSDAPEHLERAKAIAAASGVAAGEPSVVILVSDAVLITDNGGAGGASWSKPIVGEVKDGADGHALAHRVRQTVAAVFKGQQ